MSGSAIISFGWQENRDRIEVTHFNFGPWAFVVRLRSQDADAELPKEGLSQSHKCGAPTCGTTAGSLQNCPSQFPCAKPHKAFLIAVGPASLRESPLKPAAVARPRKTRPWPKIMLAIGRPTVYDR